MTLLYPMHDKTVPLEMELKHLSEQIDGLIKREARLRETTGGVAGSTATAASLQKSKPPDTAEAELLAWMGLS